MTANVEITMTGDDRDLLKAFQRQQAEILKQQRALLKMGDVGAKGTQKVKQGLEGSFGAAKQLASSLLGVGSGIGIITSAITLLKTEMDDLAKRQKGAANATIAPAKAIADARKNFTPDATLSNEQLEPALRDIAQKTETDLSIVAQVFGTASSAKDSKLENQVAIDATREALRFAPGDLTSASELAGRALDIKKDADARGINVDIRAILGFLQNIANNSRVTSLGAAGKAAVPAIGALVQRGDTFEQAGEIFATFNALLKDQEGSLTSTLVSNLGTRTAEFVPEAKGKDKRGEFTVPQSQIEAFDNAKSTTERLQVLQENAELRRQFRSKVSFDAKGAPFVDAFLNKSPNAVNAFAAARAGIKPLDQAQAAAFEGKIADIRKGELEPIAQAERQGKVNVEQFQTDKDEGLGFAGQARKEFERVVGGVDGKPGINLPGIDFINEKIQDSRFEAKIAGGKDEATAAIEMLVKLREDLRTGDRAFTPGLTPAVEKLINGQIDVLAELREGNRIQLDAANNQAPAPQQPKKRPAAALSN